MLMTPLPSKSPWLQSVAGCCQWLAMIWRSLTRAGQISEHPYLVHNRARQARASALDGVDELSRQYREPGSDRRRDGRLGGRGRLMGGVPGVAPAHFTS